MTDWRFIWEKHVKGQHGPREASTQKQILRLHGKHAVDIGASVGEYTFPLTRRFRWVHAFEPNPGKLKSSSIPLLFQIPMEKPICSSTPTAEKDSAIP